ncbi:hypothetical protein PMSM_24675 [Paenibacillus macquariensis subsp. macquariensis]|nr:hypothetical protein PMSM_24675 [Paenibacillus macquariensis subsp. macquariensis]
MIGNGKSYNEWEDISLTGIFIFAFGFAFNRELGIIDIQEPYSSLSVPLITLGIILLICSNFFEKKVKFPAIEFKGHDNVGICYEAAPFLWI